MPATASRTNVTLLIVASFLDVSRSVAHTNVAYHPLAPAIDNDPTSHVAAAVVVGIGTSIIIWSCAYRGADSKASDKAGAPSTAVPLAPVMLSKRRGTGSDGHRGNRGHT